MVESGSGVEPSRGLGEPEEDWKNWDEAVYGGGHDDWQERHHFKNNGQVGLWKFQSGRLKVSGAVQDSSPAWRPSVLSPLESFTGFLACWWQ